MKNRFKAARLRLALTLTCLLGAAGIASATTVTIPADDDLVVGARAIVKARVLSIETGLDDDLDRIFTYITLRVQQVIKGRISEGRLTLKQEGGQVAGRGSIVFGTPQFTPGERVLLYLDTWPDGSLRVHQMFLGKFSIIEDPATGREMVVRAVPGSNVSIRAARPHGAYAAGQSTDRAELKAYLEMVRARLRANLERAASFEAEHYSQVPLLAEPPEYRERRQAGSLMPHFTLIFPSLPTRWFEPDSGEPVTFLVNPDGAPRPGVIDDISAAMAAWSTVPGCRMRAVNGGTTEGCGGRGGGNVIVFNNCDGRFAPTPGCSSIIALGGLSWDTSQTRVVNGTTFYKAILGFISFNPYSSCSFENSCNIQEITTHELGHALGLGHSQHIDATMFGAAHFDGRCASIRQDDINGITFIYPAEDAGGGPLGITTGSQLPGAARGALYVHVLEATGGQMPYTWSLLAQFGRLPTGMSFTSGGVIGGTPLEEGTYNFTVQVRDAAGATAQKSFTLIVGATTTLPYDSQFVTQNVPESVQPGQTFNANLRWLNRGTETWSSTAGFKVRSQNPENNTTWGGNTVLSPSAVPPGQHLDLTFSATAPVAPGQYIFQWQLFQEGIGFFGQMSTAVQITVLPPQLGSPKIEGPASLGTRKGDTFTHQLVATGGSPPYLWAMTAGSLPAGISLNPNTGLIAGSAISAGSFPVTIRVTDTQFRAAQKEITIEVAGPPPEVTTNSLPSGVKGVGYSVQLSAAEGTPPYRWAISAGALPAGLALDRNSGIISGTPLAIGNFSFTVDVTDRNSRKARKALAIAVLAPQLSIEFADSVQALKGSPFNLQAVAAGGTPPYTWFIASGSLPGGLTLNAGTGAITGSPGESGVFVVTIGVRDQALQSASKSLRITVIDPASIPAITKVQYKSRKKKLIVRGERIDRAATLLVAGQAVNAKFSSGKLVAKKLSLSSGQYEVVIVNPNNVASEPFLLIVD